MIKLVVDAQLEAQLAEAEGLLEICDASGRTLGYFQPALPVGGLKALSPYSDEEIEQLGEQRSGRPLAEIWKDLESQTGT
ncbi:MAG: hypothetical protein K8T25_04655 [Planctomycetia bacterium]|nr:hypothetical protein [Planctomycetia bacterium]